MRSAFVSLLFFLLSSSPSVRASEPADIVFRGGKFHTVNDKQPQAEAVAVTGGKFVFVGSNKDVAAFIGKKTKVVELKGATAVPGLTDSHCHLLGIGQRELQLNLEGVSGLPELLAKIKQRALKAKPGEWITGRGWIETHWNPSVFPTRWDLDKVAPRNPVFLWRADGHGAVVNSLAFKIASIGKETPNPSGGEIMRDAKTGEPDGMLLDKAQALVLIHVPGITQAEMEKAVLVGIQRSLSLGWCQLQIAGNSPQEIDLLKRLYAEGKIKIRIYNAVSGPGPGADQLLDGGAEIGLFGGLFTHRTIKLVMDGALGSKGAALLEPYADHDSRGLLMLEEADTLRLLERALRKGIQVETHAIGDRANRTVLDWYEKAFNAVPRSERDVPDPRWRIEHAQILHPDDIGRFSKLGVIPSMQASHAVGDLYFAPSRLGMNRLKGAYAWRSLIDTGVFIAGGSDAPVERGEPLIEFYAAFARKDLQGKSGAGWHPEEAVSRLDALKMLTVWAARAAFEENLRGSIEVGKQADLTVFSTDPLSVPESKVLDSTCLMTVIGGDIAFSATHSHNKVKTQKH